MISGNVPPTRLLKTFPRDYSLCVIAGGGHFEFSQSLANYFLCSSDSVFSCFANIGRLSFCAHSAAREREKWQRGYRKNARILFVVITDSEMLFGFLRGYKQVISHQVCGISRQNCKRLLWKWQTTLRTANFTVSRHNRCRNLVKET